MVRLFEGAQRQETSLSLLAGNGVVGYHLSLSDEALLSNLAAVQSDPGLHNGRPIPPSESLRSEN